MDGTEFMRNLFVIVAGIGLCLVPAGVPAQGQTGVRQISGQVMIGGEPAPAGLPVLLTIVNQNAAAGGNFPLSRALTDASGKFVFEHLEAVGEKGKEVFSLSAHFPAYKDGLVTVDLREFASQKVTLALQPDPENNSPESPEPKVRKTEDRTAGRAAGRQPRNPEASAAFERASESLFIRHDAQASLKDLRQVTKIDPWFGPGYLLMGLAYMQLQDWSQAQWAFGEVTKVEPANAEAYLGLGSALNEQKGYAAAQKALEQCLELRTEYAEAHYELARSLWGLGKLDAAAGHAQRALEINSDYSGPHALMGNIYLQREDPEAALTEFQAYVRMDPQGSLAPAANEMIVKLKKLLGEK
jgi:tetratricopeptide (TPR) repeat protein